MKPSWRLIIDGNASGSWNMAVDEALLQQAGAKLSLPTLRLFGWDPGTLSLGYAQPHTDVDLDGLDQHHWGLVRRPTGGRAILHIDEMTYSVTAPLDDPILAGSLLESYRKISAALVLALQLIGIPVEADRQYDNGDSQYQNPVCFETPSNYEITYQGKKLMGSAQARKFNGLLQHGSLPLFGDLTRITHTLRYQSAEARVSAGKKLLARATNAETILGKIPEKSDVVNAFIEGFSRTMDVSFEQVQLSPQELTLAQSIEHNKYQTQEWTNRL